MAYSQSDLDALDRAIGTGALKVKFADGREVTYRSLADMRSIRREMSDAIAGALATPRVTFSSYVRD